MEGEIDTLWNHPFFVYRGDGECDTFFSRGFEEYYKTS